MGRERWRTALKAIRLQTSQASLQSSSTVHSQLKWMDATDRESCACKGDTDRWLRRLAGPLCSPCRSPLRWADSSVSAAPLRLPLRLRLSFGVLSPLPPPPVPTG